MDNGSKVVRLNLVDLDWMTELLTAAFLTEAPTTHLFVGPRRRTHVSYFMRSTCAYGLHFGECYASADKKAVAVWLLPGQTNLLLGRMYTAGMLSAPFRLGLSTFARFMKFTSHAENHHKAVAPQPHYYLFALGVHPEAQGRGLGSLLTNDMLRRADREGTPTYLETQNPRNVELYKKLGFVVGASGPFSGLDGLTNWGMLRPAPVG